MKMLSLFRQTISFTLSKSSRACWRKRLSRVRKVSDEMLQCSATQYFESRSKLNIDNFFHSLDFFCQDQNRFNHQYAWVTIMWVGSRKRILLFFRKILNTNLRCNRRDPAPGILQPHCIQLPRGFLSVTSIRKKQSSNQLKTSKGDTKQWSSQWIATRPNEGGSAKTGK